VIIEELKAIKSGRKELRNFGIVMAAVSGVIGGYMLWQDKGFFYLFFAVAAALLVSGIAFPGVLAPLHMVWMGIAVVAGFFVSRGILIALFYLVLTPLGLVLRMTGRDFLSRKFDRNGSSYWISTSPKEHDASAAERQF